MISVIRSMVSVIPVLSMIPVISRWILVEASRSWPWDNFRLLRSATFHGIVMIPRCRSSSVSQVFFTINHLRMTSSYDVIMGGDHWPVIVMVIVVVVHLPRWIEPEEITKKFSKCCDLRRTNFSGKNQEKRTERKNLAQKWFRKIHEGKKTSRESFVSPNDRWNSGKKWLRTNQGRKSEMIHEKEFAK